MKTPEAIAIAKRLVAVSDVVAENFSSRVMPGWGMDYEGIRQIRPDIIMLSMSGLGRTGPWKDRVSYGQTLQAWSGFTALTGFPDTDPCGPASAYSDGVAGMAGAQAVLLALIHRARSGQGQLIDLFQFEALSSLLETLVLDLSVNKSRSAPQRTGNRLPHGGGAPHGAYRCAGEDRWVAIAVFTDREWQAFTCAIGTPPPPGLGTSASRRLQHGRTTLTTWIRWWSPGRCSTPQKRSCDCFKPLAFPQVWSRRAPILRRGMHN